MLCLEQIAAYISQLICTWQLAEHKLLQAQREEPESFHRYDCFCTKAGPYSGLAS